MIPIVGLKVLQLTTSEISFATMLFSLGYLLFSYVLGRLADRFGKKRLILIALGVASFLLILCSLSIGVDSFFKWEYFLIVLGMGVAVVSKETTMGAWIPELFSRNEWLKVNGGIQGTKSVANLVGPLLGGMMVSSFQVPVSLLILSVLLIVGMGMLSTIKSVEREEVKINEGTEPFSTHFFSRVKLALREPSLRAVLLTTATLNLAMSLYQTILLLYLMTSFHSSCRFEQDDVFDAPLRWNWCFIDSSSFREGLDVSFGDGTISFFICTKCGEYSRTTVWQLKVPSTIRGEMNGMMTTLTWGMIPLGSFLAAVFAPFISYAWMIVIA